MFVLLVFSGCSRTKFDGSRTGNANQLIMEFDVLNTTDSKVLALQEGDSVDFSISSEAGKLAISLQKEGDEPVYKGVDIPTSSFQVVVNKSGEYTATVTGDNAKGSVSIIKIGQDLQ